MKFEGIRGAGSKESKAEPEKSSITAPVRAPQRRVIESSEDLPDLRKYKQEYKLEHIEPQLFA